MKKVQIYIDMWEKGDYVITPQGVGKVVEDEAEIKTSNDFEYSEVMIQHKFGCSENTSNKPISMERGILFLISKKEYDAPGN